MVIKQHIAELIYRSLDGELSPREDAELRRALEESPEDQEYYNQLERLARIAHHVPEIDPPTELKGEILGAIGQSRYSATPLPSKRSTNPVSKYSVFAPRFVYGLAAGLLLGVALGIIAQQSLIGSGALQNSELIGTLSLGESAKSRRVDSQSFSAEAMRGQMTLDAAGVLALLRVSINSENEASVTVAFPTGTLELRAIQQSDGELGGIEQQQGQIAVTGVGQRTYLFAFQNISDQESEISINVRSAEAARELKVAVPVGAQ